MIQSEDFCKVCKLSELEEKVGKRFFVNDVDVAVFKVDGNVYALSNVCVHQKAAVMYNGFIEEGKIICPSHSWQFDLKTGKVPFGTKGLDSYEVKIINEDVYIKVFKKVLDW